MPSVQTCPTWGVFVPASCLFPLLVLVCVYPPLWVVLLGHTICLFVCLLFPAARKMAVDKAGRLLSSKRLALVLDLDNTLLHCSDHPDAGRQEPRGWERGAAGGCR